MHCLCAVDDKYAEVWLNHIVRTLDLSETLVCRIYYGQSNIDLRPDFLALAAKTEDPQIKEKLLLVAHRCKDNELKHKILSKRKKLSKEKTQ